MDVITKCIASNEVYNGSVLAGVDQQGNKEVLRREREQIISIQALENKLTNRFDDINYYSS